MKQNILIIGAGAVGGIIAARLVQKNLEVEILVKYPELKRIAKKTGLHVSGHHGHFTRKVNAYLPSDLLSETFDIVMIATKATDLQDAALHILPFLNDDSLVVSLQNGICEDDLAKIVGKGRTVGCVVGWGATMHEPGIYEMTSGGEFVIGSINGIPKERLQSLKEILDHIAPTRISESIYNELYSKLIINSCISTLGAITGVTLGKMLNKKFYRDLFIEIIQEAMHVANAMGWKVEPYANKIDYYKFLQPGKLNNLKLHLLIRVIGIKYRKLKSSTLQSIERGKKTEIDWFNGYIVKKAGEYDVNVPLNRKLVQMVKEIEDGIRKPGLENFKDSFFQHKRIPL